MILLVDNYDSFTFNLVQYLGELGATVHVERNNSLGCSEAMAMQPEGIVLSPGPCDPNKAGICLELVAAAAKARIPLLGVCLGHQTIGQAFGGQVVQCHEIVHGKTSEIFHDGSLPMHGLPSPFVATRYHSLIVDRDSMPTCLSITAWTANNVIMGVRHNSLPIVGVQFHPESIQTKHGHVILQQFLNLVEEKSV